MRRPVIESMLRELSACREHWAVVAIMRETSGLSDQEVRAIAAKNLDHLGRLCIDTFLDHLERASTEARTR